MRDPATTGRVTNIELFFDLVYVFAVTQLSHYLLAHPTPTGALRAGLLLIMVWLLWVYTTWVTNWLDPERIAVRLMLLGLACASLVMSAAVIWRRVSWPRLGALAALGLLGLAAPHVTALALGACTAVVIIAVAVLDYAQPPAARRTRGPSDPGASTRAGRPTIFLSLHSRSQKRPESISSGQPTPAERCGHARGITRTSGPADRRQTAPATGTLAQDRTARDRPAHQRLRSVRGLRQCLSL